MSAELISRFLAHFGADDAEGTAEMLAGEGIRPCAPQGGKFNLARAVAGGANPPQRAGLAPPATARAKLSLRGAPLGV